MESFKKLMGCDLISHWNVVPNGNWDIIEELYNKFQNSGNKVDKIPKKIHQIWIGDMPKEHKQLIPKIIENHPEWEYKLWGEEDLRDYPMINRELYDNLSNYGSKSDVARYEILYREGGIYLDSDFEMVTSFDSLLKNDFFTGVGHSREPMVFNGLIGATKNNNLLKNLLNLLYDNFKNIDVSNNNHETIMNNTGPYFFSTVFFDYINSQKDEDIVVLPTPYFYPLPATERHKIRGRFDDLKDYIYSYNTEKTICIHLWYNSWQ